MKYLVEVTETLQRVIEIEADDERQAREKVEDDWQNEKIVLDASDFVEENIRVIQG